MPDLPDLWQAAQDAVFAALKAGVPDELATVRANADENTPLPFVLVGDMDGEPAGGKGERHDRMTLDIQIVYRGPSRRGLLAIMGAVRNALDNQEIEAPGVAFCSPSWMSGATTTGADGVTRVGVQQYEVIAEPA